MAINFEVIQQRQLSGLRQADARPFQWAGIAFSRLGDSVQSVGRAGSDFLSRQKDVADDIGFNELKNDFDLQQKANEAKLDQLKANPSMLIKSEFEPGVYTSALTSAAHAKSLKNEDRIKNKKKFKNLSEANQARFLSYTKQQTNLAQAAAKLATTKLLVQASKQQDTESLASMFAEWAKPEYPETFFDRDLNNYKAEIRDKQSKGEYQPEEVDALFTQVDKKAAKFRFDRDRVNASISGDPKELMKVDQNLLNGKYGVPGENVNEKRLVLWSAFNTAQSNKAEKSQREATAKANKAYQDIVAEFQNTDLDREKLHEKIKTAAAGALRGRPTLTDKLYKHLEDYGKPEKESPNSPNQILKNEIADIDLTAPDAREQLEMMGEVVDAATNSEVDAFTIKQSTERIEQINKAIKGLDDADVAVFEAEKKFYRERIFIKTKQKGSGPLAMFTGNEAEIRGFALEYNKHLLEHGVKPKEAWVLIEQIIESDMFGATIDKDKIEDQLFENKEKFNAVIKKVKNLEGLNDEEKELHRLYMAGITANQSPMRKALVDAKKNNAGGNQ